MKLTALQDIDAPIDYVFRRVSNFDAYTRQALRKGAQVNRVDGAGPVVVGSAWDVAFTYRKKDRKLRATVGDLTAPECLIVLVKGAGLSGETKVTLVALSRKTTRINVAMTVAAQSLSGRLLLQSLRLARGTLNARFDKRVADQLKTFPANYRRDSAV